MPYRKGHRDIGYGRSLYLGRKICDAVGFVSRDNWSCGCMNRISSRGSDQKFMLYIEVIICTRICLSQD